jgi:hypothetical protein
VALVILLIALFSRGTGGPETATTADVSAPPGTAVAGSVTGDGNVSPGVPLEVKNGDPCYPTAGYRDVPGSDVTLSADDGETLATGNMVGTGEIYTGQPRENPRFDEVFPCTWNFDLGQVNVGDGRFFKIQIGRRGAVTVPREQLANIALNLN